MQKYQFVGGAKTSEKYPLINGTSHKCPFLLNKRGTGLNVLGEVYDIGDDSAVFDAVEYVPILMDREIILVELDSGQTTEAHAYVLNDFKEELLGEPFILDYSKSDVNFALMRDAKEIDGIIEEIIPQVKKQIKST